MAKAKTLTQRITELKAKVKSHGIALREHGKKFFSLDRKVRSLDDDVGELILKQAQTSNRIDCWENNAPAQGYGGVVRRIKERIDNHKEAIGKLFSGLTVAREDIREIKASHKMDFRQLEDRFHKYIESGRNARVRLSRRVKALEHGTRVPDEYPHAYIPVTNTDDMVERFEEWKKTLSVQHDHGTLATDELCRRMDRLERAEKPKTRDPYLVALFAVGVFAIGTALGGYLFADVVQAACEYTGVVI